ncbi:AP-3 complex subunit mu-1 [Scleropages formosus]|uniref:AP-3 complex subunit mu-1 n=1 Tax=Scleropages formosus TaxID=113540 RepID=UPI000878DDB7|nr:AP-3 complex subunit mu-1-like [Scleropages formosus]XP_018621770.1 AP-3 complex subunit mu-1-like [Scleropages formosus]XP_018621771.1 AP-3 complex subunit mu-1-like [Scleropages formosus]
MIHSLFLVSTAGHIFLEKHWKSVISRSVCDYLFEAQGKASAPENVPPVIATPHHYLISVYRDRIFFVAVIQTEVPPLFVIEFLHRVAETFQDYFGECSEASIKDNVVIVYELLEEMLDNGFPLATEANILKEMIKPPTILRSVVNTITGSSNVGGTLPTGQLSNIPWRRTGVKYTNNEAYFDVVEEIDAILDKSGTVVFAEIQGVIDACVKLSGMPDLTLSFVNPRLLDDVSFHPCVRFKRWEAERVLSFIPPDGNFRLMSYHVNAQNLVAIPVYVKQNVSFFETGSSGRLDITVGPKQTMGKTIEDVVITVHMPKVVLNANLTTNQGTSTYDPVTKVLVWDIGKLNQQKVPNLKGSLSLQSGAPRPDENPTLNIDLRIQQLAISGLKVNRLNMFGEKYKPFKGVKYVTKAGKFQVRT